MDRIKVDSSSLHSLGHDGTGTEAAFHQKGCARTLKAPETKECNCAGGEPYHYPGVPAELHSMVISSQSVGASFARMIKGAKNPETGALLYPAVKVTEPVIPELKPA